MNLYEAIYSRRAVRNYTDERVPGDVVRALLEAAVQAPSAVNQQPWAFVVVQDRDLMESLSDRAKQLNLNGAGYDNLPDALLAKMLEGDFGLFYNAGTLLVICARKGVEHADRDCYLAGENLMLAASEEGLGTCVIGLALPVLNETDIRKELHIPDDFEPVLPVILGYPAEKPKAPIRKSPEILSWKICEPAGVTD